MSDSDHSGLMSEAELIAYLDRPEACYGHGTWRHEEDLEARMRRGGDEATIAYLDSGDLEEERLESRENRLLLLAGTVCANSGHPELWSTIWNIWHHAGELDHEDEFEVLAELTARARAGDRSLTDEAATLRRWAANG